MALDANKFLLKEGFLRQVTWNTPENVGVSGTPQSHYTNIGQVGYFRRGTIVMNLTREYAEAPVATPGFLVRKDLTFKRAMFTAESFQFDSNTWAFRDGMLVQTGYVDGPDTYDIGHLGFDEPVQNPSGFVLETQLTDGTPYNFAIYYGRYLAEDISETRSGDDYVTPAIEIQMFPHPNFDVFDVTDAQKCFGARWLVNP